MKKSIITFLLIFLFKRYGVRVFRSFFCIIDEFKLKNEYNILKYMYVSDSVMLIRAMNLRGFGKQRDNVRT